MTSVTISSDRIAALERSVAALADDVGFLVARARAEQARRESWDELRRDLAPVANGAMEAATREFDALRQEVDVDEVISLLRSLVIAAPSLHRLLDTLGRLDELSADLSPLTGETLATVTDRLAAAEQRGYFEFARAAGGVMDKVVTGFDADDVEQLGDNVVTILHTVKELTQPEMLAILQRMLGALHLQQAAIEREPAEPPGLLALLRRMRDPNVRRGIGRALDTLGSVTAQTGAAALHEIHDLKTKGDGINARDDDRRS